MDSDVDGKTVLVVGGNGYLGSYFCERLVASGSRVVSWDLAPDPLVEPEMMEKKFHYMSVDVSCSESVSNATDKLFMEVGSIHAVVYSVTAKPKDFYKPFTECSIEGWNSVVNVELSGAFNVAKSIGRVFEDRGVGKFIFMSSIYGMVGNDQRIYEGSNLDSVYASGSGEHKQLYSHGVYAAVKGGVISFARFLAAYWGGIGITVNVISPGGVRNDNENQTFVSKYADRVPLKRKAEREEIFSCLTFLISDGSSYMTGHNLVVDGGWTAW